MDRLVPAICIAALIIAILSYTRKRIQKDGLGKAIYLGVLAGIELLLLVLVIDYLPKLTSKVIHNFISPVTLRWALLYLLAIAWIYPRTRKNSGRRGLYSILILMTTLLLGWGYDRWIGILFISLPVLFIFIFVVDRVAQIILPSSNPEDKNERKQKTRVFVNYLLGIQYPFRVASTKAGRGFDERIAGDPNSDDGQPGLVWTWPHQVAGISKGIEFNRVDGPGTIYTRMYETPVALVDLRTHMRTREVEAVTSDGMQVTAVVFMAFAIDRGIWPKTEWSKAQFSRMKYLFGGNTELDYLQGSYPYSSARVRKAINTVGINTNLQDGERPEIYWDEWIIKLVEQAAREVLAERSLDELWRPRKDGPGVSAFDEMAVVLRQQVAPRLAEIGVQLSGVRIVNYKFDPESPVVKQNIKTWSTFWEQQITEAHADAEAIYREEIEKAHAFSKSVLLDAIAESVNAARVISNELPRHVIAQYYVHALEEYIKQQPGVDSAESKKRVDDIKGFLLYNRTEANE
ncbi:MAG TPA: SPFH domain-containing protein [Anaerolineales bacterium]|nr:SPFH domain-containing protein [Anaerolineales bacterium]